METIKISIDTTNKSKIPKNIRLKLGIGTPVLLLLLLLLLSTCSGLARNLLAHASQLDREAA